MLPDYAEFDQAAGLDWYRLDPNLRALLDRHLPDPAERALAEEHVGRFGTLVGQVIAPRAEVTDKHGPVLRRYDRWGQVVDEVVHNASWTQSKDDLVRNVRSAEDNYLLYVRKREEARISDALDTEHIVNVALAEAPTVPALPTLKLGWLLAGSFFAASGLSLGAAYAVDRLDPSFRTAEELGRYLEVKVLASIPASAARS